MIDNFVSKKVLKNLEDIPITERPNIRWIKKKKLHGKDKKDGWVKIRWMNMVHYTHK